MCQPKFAPEPPAAQQRPESKKRKAPSSSSSDFAQAHAEAQKRKAPSNTNRTRSLSLEELQSNFHLPINEVACKLGVCVTVLKQQCRELGINRWPFRKVRKLDHMLTVLENTTPQKARPFALTNGEEERQRKICTVKKTLMELLADPNSSAHLKLGKLKAAQAAKALQQQEADAASLEPGNSGLVIEGNDIGSSAENEVDHESAGHGAKGGLDPMTMAAPQLLKAKREAERDGCNEEVQQDPPEKSPPGSFLETLMRVSPSQSDVCKGTQSPSGETPLSVVTELRLVTSSSAIGRSLERSEDSFTGEESVHGSFHKAQQQEIDGPGVVELDLISRLESNGAHGAPTAAAAGEPCQSGSPRADAGSPPVRPLESSDSFGAGCRKEEQCRKEGKGSTQPTQPACKPKASGECPTAAGVAPHLRSTSLCVNPLPPPLPVLPQALPSPMLSSLSHAGTPLAYPTADFVPPGLAAVPAPFSAADLAWPHLALLRMQQQQQRQQLETEMAAASAASFRRVQQYLTKANTERALEAESAAACASAFSQLLSQPSSAIFPFASFSPTSILLAPGLGAHGASQLSAHVQGLSNMTLGAQSAATRNAVEVWSHMLKGSLA